MWLLLAWPPLCVNSLAISSLFGLSGTGIQYQKAVALAVASANAATPAMFPAGVSVLLRQTDTEGQASDAALAVLNDVQVRSMLIYLLLSQNCH